MTKSMKQKSLARAACAIGLGLAICAGAPTAAFAEYMGFPDVNPTDWYASTVEWATENHVINGSSGMWDPAGVVNRGMAATILHNYSGDPAPAEDATFADADTFGWAGSGIAWAQDKGIFNGYGGAYGNFGPWDTLTREQAATVLYNMFGNGENTGSLALDAFDDSQDVSLWARAGVAWAAHYKIMGQGGTISPHATCTRAEFVTMLMRVSELDLDDDTDKPSDGGSTTTPGDDQKPGDTGGDQTPDDKPGQGDEQKPGSGDDEKPGTGDDQKPEEKPGDDDDEKDPDQGGDQGGTTNPGGDQGGSTTDPGEGDEKPQEPTGSYNLADGTWTLKGTVDAKNGYYNNVVFYGRPAGYVNDGVSPVKAQTMLYNADLATDVASVTNKDGISLKQGVDFDVSRTFNESAGTITTKVTGKNGNTGSLTVTEKVRQASALIVSPIYCGVGWQTSNPMRFNDGKLHMLYRLMPTVTTSGKALYEWAQTSRQCTGVFDSSNNTVYYVKDNDSRVNGKTVDSLVCSWFEGETPESGSVLEEGKDGDFVGENYYVVRSTVTDLKTDDCGNPKCDYNGRHDFSIADQRQHCGCISLNGRSGILMATIRNGNLGNIADGSSQDYYVLPVNLTD